MIGAIAAYTPGANDKRGSLVLAAAANPLDNVRREGSYGFSLMSLKPVAEVGPGCGILTLNMEEEDDAVSFVPFTSTGKGFCLRLLFLIHIVNMSPIRPNAPATVPTVIPATFPGVADPVDVNGFVEVGVAGKGLLAVVNTMELRVGARPVSIVIELDVEVADWVMVMFCLCEPIVVDACTSVVAEEADVFVDVGTTVAVIVLASLG
jgi:hypothetical protein